MLHSTKMSSSDYFVREKELGRGSFGVVYRVRSKGDNDVYVIKEQLGNSNMQMVANEVQILKKLRHRNIIGYHGSWIENRKAFILMEYASHGTLQELMERKNKPFPEKEAIFYFAQIIQGLNHIHEKSILHRDLKPGNLMLDGFRGDVVKIGDFGIAKIIKENSTQTIVGTILYMAPEILQAKKYDYKCDIWSSGVILYELLTQRFPFDTGDSSKIVEQITRGELRSLPKTEISSDTVKLTNIMLRRNPAERPRSNQLIHCPVLFS